MLDARDSRDGQMTIPSARLRFLEPRSVLALAGALAIIVAVAWASHGSRSDHPFRPSSDGEVLETLTAGRGNPRSRELLLMRRTLEANPDDLDLALALARRNIEESRSTSDPRFLGHAQAALARWWDLPSPPPEVLLLRATIRQSTHDFDGALRDLDAALLLRPRDPQAWLTRSVALTVRGDYERARASCAPLASLTDPLVLGVCTAGVDGVTGNAAGAYERLSRALDEASAHGASAAEREWALSTLGEIATRRGDRGAAERHFEAALALDPSDLYALGAWSDLLLDEGRPNDVAARLTGHENSDGLLLRLAIAERMAGLPRATDHVAMLRARFDASRARGDTVHRREEARFALSVEGDAVTALRLAKANWDVQKEPWDVRVYLEAALAAGDRAAAGPILAWLGGTHLEDPVIAALAEKLERLH